MTAGRRGTPSRVFQHWATMHMVDNFWAACAHTHALPNTMRTYNTVSRTVQAVGISWFTKKQNRLIVGATTYFLPPDDFQLQLPRHVLTLLLKLFHLLLGLPHFLLEDIQEVAALRRLCHDDTQLWLYRGLVSHTHRCIHQGCQELVSEKRQTLFLKTAKFWILLNKLLGEKGQPLNNPRL